MFVTCQSLVISFMSTLHMSISLSNSRGLPASALFLPYRYGTIISTKAILDKTTNKCKGIFFFTILIIILFMCVFRICIISMCYVIEKKKQKQEKKREKSI